MKKAFLTAIVSAGALASAPVSAATCTSTGTNSCFINYTANVGGTFGNTDPAEYPAHFKDVFTFVTNYARNASVVIDSTRAGLNQSYNVNFISNGVKLNSTVIPATSTGVTEQRALLNFRIPAGAQQILVTGSSQPNGFYNGILSLSGVPEPSTWALMILGIGFAGVALRQRRRQAATPAFA